MKNLRADRKNNLVFRYRSSLFSYIIEGMNWIAVGLGNSGAEYEWTRHNTGRIALLQFAQTRKLGEWVADKHTQTLYINAEVEKTPLDLILSEDFMNNSGKPLRALVRSKAQAAKLIVLHDDLDLPLGKFKISFDRGAAGHRGVQSVIRMLKTSAFVRIRIGISPKRKPQGEKVLNFLMSNFRASERLLLHRALRDVGSATELIVTEGKEKAMSMYNS